MKAPLRLDNNFARHVCGMPPSYHESMAVIDSNRLNAPHIGSMGMFTRDPVADAADHFDAAANTFTKDVEYLGVKLTAEVNRCGHLVDLLQDDGTCWMEEFSERALRKILAMACEGEDV